VIRSWAALDRAGRWRVAIIAGGGYLAPWMTGVGVKLYLDAFGRPTYPWTAFLNPAAVAVIVPATAVWAFPFLLLAWVAALAQLVPDRPWLTRSDRWLIAYGGLIGGLIGEVQLFVEVFWLWNPIALFAGFLLPAYYLPQLGAGLAIGAAVAVAQRAVRRSVLAR